MGRIRALFRKRAVRASATVSTLTLAVLASDTAVAVAVPCGIKCLSDRRLKRAVRAI